MLKTAWNFFKKNVPFFGLLTLLVVGCYINSLNNVFISDDLPSIVNNPKIGQFSNLFNIQTFGRNVHIYIILKIFGLIPAPFRLFNIIMHLGNVWLLFVLVFIITKKNVAAFAAAAFFAVHPLLVESVTWISGGGYSQYTFFFLISLIFYILHDKNKNMTYYSVSLLFFFFTLISNRSGISLPAIIFVYDLSSGNVLKKWKYYLPFFALSGIWVLLFLGPFSDRVETLQNTFYQPGGLDNPLIQIPTAIYSYIKLIFFPMDLTFYHTELQFSAIEFSLAVIVTLTYFGLLLYTYFKQKEYFLWLSFFIIPLFITLTPFRIAWTVAERYAYMSLIGILVPVVLIGVHFYEKKKLSLIVTALFTLILTLLAIRTIVRNIDWKTDENLWIATGKKSPSSPWNHNNLGDLYARKGNYKRSIAEFKRAIELLPNYADAYHNMGNTYREIGDLNNALKSYEMALKYNPALWQSYLNAGAVYFDKEDYEKATELTMKAISIVPTSSPLYTNLAIIYFRIGNLDEAKRYYTHALELDPTNDKARLGLMQLSQPKVP